MGISASAALSSGLWIPLAFRRLAFASWAFLSRCGIGPSLRVADCHANGLFARVADRNGVSTFHMGEMRWGWVSSLSRSPGVPPQRMRARCGSTWLRPNHVPGSECRLGQPPIPACWNDETSSRIRSRSPFPSSPYLRRGDGSLTSWAFPSASHPAVASDAREGGDRSGTLTWGSGTTSHSFHVASCRTRVFPVQAHPDGFCRLAVG
jgi:hypothetical protein